MDASHNGPDELAPAEHYMTWQRQEGVKLYLESNGPAAEKPISVMTALKQTVKKSPDHPALCYKIDDKWENYTYREYYKAIKHAARAFIKLGLEAYHGVGIIGFNSPEWFISDMAAIFAGGFATGIYTTSSPEACYYVAHSAECNILVVENDQQLQKILEIRHRLPHLRAIVQYKGTPKEKYHGVYSWTEMMACGDIGFDVKEKLAERIKAQSPNKCCTLIFTSGTTGNPKGVMISHDNIIWTTRMVCELIKTVYNEEVVVTYLPLSHIAGQLIDIYAPMMAGATVYFAQPDALKGSLVATLKEARPTAFLGVPRVWEKMQEGMVSAGRASGYLQRTIAAWARGVGLEASTAEMHGKPRSWSFLLADRLVFSKVRAALGLDRCRLCISGAAPIMRDTLDFFFSLNIPIMEVYGMSESSGPHTFAYPPNYLIGSVGKEFPGATTLFSNQDQDGNGEVCLKGRHVFMGYINKEKETKEILDDSGYLHSGDIGWKDSNGYIFITGRIKELIITAGGENIPPIPIEDGLKVLLPCVSNCMLVGDKHKFLSMLITLKTEADPDTMEPKDALARDVISWCLGLGSSSTTVSEILNGPDELVMKAIQAGIDAANAKAASRAQYIQKWCLLPRDFSLPGGELGPTLKLKRSVVANIYNSTIESFYRGTESSPDS